MKYLNAIIVLLYIAALILIIVEFSGMWALATALLLILIICSLQKSYYEKLHEKLQNRRDSLIEKILDKLDLFSRGIEVLKNQMDQDSIAVENRLSEIKDFSNNEISKTYRDLARKIVDIENRLSSLKRTLGAAYSIIDERLGKVENILNLESKEEKQNE